MSPHQFSRTSNHAPLVTDRLRSVAAVRVLVTGAGGPSAQSIVKALTDESIELHLADMDPYASGLHLVPAEQRVVLWPARAPQFADHVLKTAIARGIHVVWSTVDAEFVPLAQHAAAFTAAGITLLQAPLDVARQVLDKALLLAAARDILPGPTSFVLSSDVLQQLEADPTLIAGPWLVKPRAGAGSRGVRRCETMAELHDVPLDGTYLLQEWLPGEELSIDVLATPEGRALVAVPRVRLKVDSGVAIVGRTVRDEALEQAAAALVTHLRLPYISNVQVKRRADGTACLLEINPRVPGTMPLTVAAGVNMPRLALQMAVEGGRPTDAELEWHEIGVVRYLTEHLVPITELGQSPLPR